LADWHSPNADVSLQALGGSKYRVKYDYTGFTLPHLTSTPFPSRTLVGLHYADWSSVNRANDFSNNLSPNYLANTKIQVVDSAGNVIFGSAAP
jgi:hypothetical protein